MAMRSSFELAARMAMSTRLRKMRSLFCVDSIVVAVVVVEGGGGENCAGVGAAKRFLGVEQVWCLLKSKIRRGMSCLSIMDFRCEDEMVTIVSIVTIRYVSLFTFHLLQ